MRISSPINKIDLSIIFYAEEVMREMTLH